jgi:hypothetical protein
MRYICGQFVGNQITCVFPLIGRRDDYVEKEYMIWLH